MNENIETTASKFASILKWTKRDWAEDEIGVLIGVGFFAISLVASALGLDISGDYSIQPQWPCGAILVGLTVMIIAHYLLRKIMLFSSYCSILIIAVLAKAIGSYRFLVNIGLSGSVWAIFLGMLAKKKNLLLLNTEILNGEFYIKIGVCLLCMDFNSIALIGPRGLMVAWGDTCILLCVGICIALRFRFDIKDAILIAGSTSICGSSAATAISSAIHERGYQDQVCQAIIAIMGLCNTPLIPLMPLLFKYSDINARVVGAWIGGSIDSTGQVAASGRNGGESVLQTAIIIKMTQNIMIGPVTLFLTSIFHGSFRPRILLDKFPLFVLGFLITSAVTTLILQTGMQNRSLSQLLISNAWSISEFITMIGFVCIGYEINVNAFFSGETQNKVFFAYIIIQLLDICTTFGWSYLMFQE